MEDKGFERYVVDLVRSGRLAASPADKLYLAQLALRDVRGLETFVTVFGSPPRVVTLVRDLRAEVEAKVRDLTTSHGAHVTPTGRPWPTRSQGRGSGLPHGRAVQPTGPGPVA